MVTSCATQFCSSMLIIVTQIQCHACINFASLFKYSYFLVEDHGISFDTQLMCLDFVHFMIISTYDCPPSTIVI